LSYSNHYKSQVENIPKASSNSQKEVKEPRETKPKKGLTIPNLNGNSKFNNFLKDERTRNILGIFLILLSGVLLLALTSYLFTWKVDQDKLFQKTWLDILFDPEIEIDNWLGTFGALISHQLINNGFGISSFVFVLLTFLVGFKVLFKIELLPFWRTTGISMFFLIWISLTMGSLFKENFLFLGGAFGYHTNQWLMAVIGSVGTGVVLFFSLSVFLIITFNISVNSLITSFTGIDDAEKAENTSEASPVATEIRENEVLSEEPFLADEEEGVELTTDLEPQLAQTAPVIIPEKLEELIIADEYQALELETSAAAKEEKLAAVELDDDFEITVANHVEEAPKFKQPAAEEEEDIDFAVEQNIGDDFSDDDELGEGEMVDYDPLLDLSKYRYPPIDILVDHGDGSIKVERGELEENKNKIVDTLKNYNIGISKIKATIGPTVTLYEIVPEAGVRISKIKNLEDDIALSLAALGIRIIAPIPGKGTIGIEVPNQTPDVVSMRTVINSEKFQNAKMELPVALGKTINNETFVVDLAKMPHLLMAGATGQGKSVGLNCILASLLYKKHPAQVKFVLVDPKKVELTLFNKIERHFLAKLPGEEEAIITDTSKVVSTLNSLCIEMDERYDLLKNAQCRNIKEYNVKFVKRKLNPNNGHRFLPYIVLVVDEFADLIMTAGKEVELPIARLAQLARAIGIHLIIATQRPSVNIITGTIKANFPSRIAFRVTSKIDSRTILDTGGAEQLIGRGDMLYSNGNELIRLQCAFVDTPEVEEITEFIGNQQGYADAHLLPEYVGENEGGGASDSFEDMDRDALFDDAARVVVINQQGSASLLQRKLKLGYNRAGRIVDQLEAAGIIGPFEGSKARQVLVADEISLDHILKSLPKK
jgi:DNA segregation ATPase FtsK/SpoIIIE, S-DNA-T family